MLFAGQNTERERERENWNTESRREAVGFHSDYGRFSTENITKEEKKRILELREFWENWRRKVCNDRWGAYSSIHNWMAMIIPFWSHLMAGIQLGEQECRIFS
jgi:hypothetical protein